METLNTLEFTEPEELLAPVAEWEQNEAGNDPEEETETSEEPEEDSEEDADEVEESPEEDEKEA